MARRVAVVNTSSRRMPQVRVAIGRQLRAPKPALRACLNWIGKDAVVKHHKDMPFRLLEPVPALSLPSPSGRGVGGEGDYSGNLIVQGDNLHALKALLPRYAGQVKCIYIDPPYNTGNEGWVYNDNVDSPEIRRWLGEVVGKEGETLDRHDRWLCMMYPRLVLLKQFLREDGVILMSLDSNEHRYAEVLLDEIFGAANRIETFVWKKSYGGGAKSKQVVNLHEYILCFARNKERGSGTTGHAVLKQNAEDGGKRRFILVEMDENIAQNVTHERIKRVAQGYTNAKGQTVDGLGGGFQFCRLSAESLFDADGQIRSDVSFAQLAEFVWFAETGSGYTLPSFRGDAVTPGIQHAGMDSRLRGNDEAPLSPLLGIHEGRAIYLLYNGILKDRTAAGGNVLTGAVFDVLPPFAGPKVIYAAANRMGSRAAREGITFKQTPYALEV